MKRRKVEKSKQRKSTGQRQTHGKSKRTRLSASTRARRDDPLGLSFSSTMFDRPSVWHLCCTMGIVAPQCPGAVAEWDNTGLLAGSYKWPLRRTLLTIDLTRAVLEEAKLLHCDAIISYHPPIFKPLKEMTYSHTLAPEELNALALANRIAVYSPHTALDAAPGGTNDVLARICSLVDLKPFTKVALPATKSKLVVFVPDTHVDQVAEAVFATCAGFIGDYEKCSFRVKGEGTFLGGRYTKPVIGKKGRFERVDEVRLEIVFLTQNLDEVVHAVRKSHPYETPAFDIYQLQAIPLNDLGPGRVGKFPKTVVVRELARKLKRRLRANSVSVVGNGGRVLKSSRCFICVGSAGSMPFEAKPRPCQYGDIVITGEIRHHDALRYERAGVSVIALGHWASERPVLRPLAARLKKELPGVEFIVSRADKDPFRAV